MATINPSDADIFDDDDGPSPAGGGTGGSGRPPAPPPSPAKRQPAASKSTKTAKPVKKPAPKPQKFKIGGKEVYDDLTYELHNRLVKAPKVQREKLAAAMAGMAQPGISVPERLALKKVIADANKELKKIELENKSYVRNQQRFQAVQSDTGARLSALQDYMQKNNGELSESQVRRLRAMEARLMRTISNSDLSETDHAQNETVVKQLRKLEKLTERMPDVLQKRFDEIDEKTSVLITAQQEAAALVAETNAKMKDWGKRTGMRVLDFMGLGPFTLGNAVRLGAGAYRGAKAVGSRAGAVKDYITAQRVLRGSKTHEASEIGSLIQAKGHTAPLPVAKPTPLPPSPPTGGPEIPPAEFDPDDPLTHPRNKKGATLRSPTQNADQLEKIADQIDQMEEAVVARVGLQVSTMEDRLKEIQERHDAAAIKPGKPHVPRGKMGARKAKDRFGAVMEARRAAAQKVDAADAQEPMIELRNGPHRPMSRTSATTIIPGVDAAKLDAAKETAEKVVPIAARKAKKTKDKDKATPVSVAAPVPVSQQEENARESSDYQEDSLREAKRLNDILTAHAAAQARFNERLLGQLRGRSRPASQSNALGATIGNLASSIGGLGKMLPGLMGMLGKGLAVFAAWEAGKYIGNKIYESQAVNIGKGVDATVSGITHFFGGETADDKAAKAWGMKPSREAKGKVTDLTKKPNVSPVNLNSPAGSGRGVVNPAPVIPDQSGEKAPTPSSAVSPILTDNGQSQATPVQLPPVTVTGKKENLHSPAGENYPIAAGGQESQSSYIPNGKDGSGGGRVTDFMGKLFSKSSGVDTEGLHPKMQDNLVRMGSEYFQATGKKLNFNSAFRSLEEQEKLFRTKPPGMAGKPGSSLHNFGLAVDIPSVQANELDKLGLLGKYGFTRPIANEKWHVQPAGISVAAAKAGIFSADSPVDQGQPRSQMASAKQQAPSVTNANYEIPKSGAGGGQGVSRSPTPSMGTAGGTRVSATSIPTFDASDGAFLALNTGII